MNERAQMPQEQFSLDARRNGSTLFLALAGEFDSAVTGDVEQLLESPHEPAEHIVFDLGALTFIDITALKVILKAHERAQANGSHVTVIRPRGLANRIFTLTRAGETLELVHRL